MKKQTYIKLIPFGIAVLLTLISFIQVLMIPSTVNEKGETVNYVVSDSILYASFGLLIVLIFIIQKKEYWKHSFAILLIIAFTPLIQFYNQTFSFGIGFLQLEITALGLLIFHLILNKEPYNDFKKIFEISEETKQKNKKLKSEQFESRINIFEKKFSTKSKTELERIVDENSLIPEAIEAAKRLIKKE